MNLAPVRLVVSSVELALHLGDWLAAVKAPWRRGDLIRRVALAVHLPLALHLHEPPVKLALHLAHRRAAVYALGGARLLEGGVALRVALAAFDEVVG